MRVFSLAIIAIFVAISCTDDDQDMVISSVEASAAYTFERNGESTVSFSGQTTRIEMATALSDALLHFDGMAEASLVNMYSNENDPFSSTDLNSSDKNIKSKVAASADFFALNTAASIAIKNELEESLKIQSNEVFANRNNLATAGAAGQIADGSSTRYVDANGLEHNQVFAKSLIGALMLDQALNNYLSPTVLDDGDNRANNENDITEAGRSYTTMEHKWDEAYGYLYGASQNPADPNPTLGDDQFLNTYLGRLENDEDFTGIADDIYDAFKLGRAAIVAGDYQLRDEQANIIKEKLSLVPAVRAVHYLIGGKNAVENNNMGSAFHDLSEGYAFVYSLQFTNNPATDAPYFSREEVQGFIDEMMSGEHGLWNVDTDGLQTIAETIANRFNFNVEDA
ncbi:MAG: DUF4856 domain-containing protein [Leeuwenhoekiella sp.]